MGINGRLLGLLAFLVVCIMLAVGVKAAEPYNGTAVCYITDINRIFGRVPESG